MINLAEKIEKMKTETVLNQDQSEYNTVESENGNSLTTQHLASESKSVRCPTPATRKLRMIQNADDLMADRRMSRRRDVVVYSECGDINQSEMHYDDHIEVITNKTVGRSAIPKFDKYNDIKEESKSGDGNSIKEDHGFCDR